MSALSLSYKQGLAAVSTCLLAACAGDSADPLLAACPPAQIAVPADQIGHNNRDGELRFVARMGELASSCRQEEDDVEVDIAFTMSAERGPAFEDRSVGLVYFLATVDPNRAIIDKQILNVQLDFLPDQPISALREEVTLRLPASTEASGANYNLYLGFQPDQQPEQAEAPQQTGAPEQTAAIVPGPTAASTSENPISNGAATDVGANALEIVFDVNSSILPNGADDQLRTFIQTLDKDESYVLRVQTSVDSDSSVIGADSVDETERYNLWLAERRFKRVEAWLQENADGRQFTLEPSIIESEDSRYVRIELSTVG